MKYVVFLDILGFKDRLKKMTQYQAEDFIRHFSTTAFNQWEEERTSKLKGYIVSDSFIIYSEDTSSVSLSETVHAVLEICKREFADNSILLRGAIAKGSFDRLEAKEISTLKKGLIVGQAYIDAYLLEGTIKSTGIVLSNDVYDDIQNLGGYSEIIYRERINKEDRFFMRYLSLDYLMDPNNLSRFTKLAVESNWLPHYYNTFYFSMIHEKNDKKLDQLFINILDIISDSKPGENWRMIDAFIKNSFSTDVIPEFQTRFLRFIRQSIIK